jgi:hypothetical protein
MEITDKKQRPPDLQELVARFGGYSKITAEGWAEYDTAMAEWQLKRREALILSERRARARTAGTGSLAPTTMPTEPTVLRHRSAHAART